MILDHISKADLRPEGIERDISLPMPIYMLVNASNMHTEPFLLGGET